MNNQIECKHGKIKRIINVALGLKTLKTTYATIREIEVRALRKGRVLALYFAHPLDKVRLVKRVFEI